jgi:hypothetical protein
MGGIRSVALLLLSEMNPLRWASFRPQTGDAEQKLLYLRQQMEFISIY